MYDSILDYIKVKNKEKAIFSSIDFKVKLPLGFKPGHASLKFFTRTVLVKNNDIDVAYKALDRILRNEKVLERARRNMYYEKPYQERNRVSLDKCRRIYHSEMNRKIEFVMRKNRVDPWPR